jgi:hypothetical protein
MAVFIFISISHRLNLSMWRLRKLTYTFLKFLYGVMFVLRAYT